MDDLTRTGDSVGDPLPITAICIVGDKTRCPPGFTPVSMLLSTFYLFVIVFDLFSHLFRIVLMVELVFRFDFSFFVKWVLDGFCSATVHSKL